MEEGRIQGILPRVDLKYHVPQEEKEVQKAKQLIDEIKAVSIVKCHNSRDPVEFKESEKKKLKAVLSNGGKLDPRCDQ